MELIAGDAKVARPDRESWHPGPKDPPGPLCPSCGKVPAHLAELADGSLTVAICSCGTWTTYQVSPRTGRLALVERREPQVRQRRPL